MTTLFDLQQPMGYELKDNVHIFHLVPSSNLCDHWFGHNLLVKSRTSVIRPANAHFCPCINEGVFDRTRISWI